MTCTVESITTAEGLAQLAHVWDDLAARAGATHPFVTHTWMQTWWEAFGGGEELMVLLVRKDGELVAIAPLRRGTERLYGARHRTIRFMANEHSPRCDFIVTEHEAYEAIAKFLTAEADVLQLCDVPSESPTVRELVRHAGHNGLLSGIRRGPDSPVLATTGTWNDYFDSLSSNRRWFLRNRLKRLSKSGTVSVETITDVTDALEDGYRLEAAAWKGNAGTAINCDTNVRRFYTTLAGRAAVRGWLRLYFLKVNARRIAFAYCLEYRDRMFLLKPGFDPDYSDVSPGTLLFYLVLQQIHGTNVVAYDFLGYDDHWKRQWAPETAPHETLFVYARQPLTRLDHYTRFALLPRLRRARDLVLRSQR